MMPNVLQYPIALAAILRIGAVVVNVNPLYTPRELEHQLKDSGARAILILENFATTLQQVIRNTEIKRVVLASMGDMLGFKGKIVNFVVRRVKKMVPEFSLPGAHCLTMRFQEVQISASRARSSITLTSLFCSTPEGQPVSRKALPSPIGTLFRMCCNLKRGCNLLCIRRESPL